MAKELGLTVTLKRVPPVESFERADESRYQLFVKTLWQGIYTNCTGYTVLLVPSYFDFVRLKTYFKAKNAQVAMISEYTDKKECQRLRTMYEMNECPVLMITERALVFQKIRVRFARNLILYAIPESPDIIEDNFAEMLKGDYWETILKHRLNKLKLSAASKEERVTTEELAHRCKMVIREGRTANSSRSIVGLFTKWDNLVLERMVGTANFRQLLSHEAKDAFHFG